MNRPALVVFALAVTLGAPAPAAAPAPKLPLIGGDAVDAWGTPIKTADKTAIRALFVTRRFEELTALMEALQALSESDCQLELVGLDAFEVFVRSDDATNALLDAWVKASPKSWAPLVARGAFYGYLAEQRRGSGWAKDTSEEQWKAMRETASLARSDLDASIARHPTFAARRALIDLNKLTGFEEPGKTQLDLALKQCPGSWQMNMKYFTTLAPEWSGDPGAMDAFASAAPVKLNPKLALLKGAKHGYQCIKEPDHKKAVELCDLALKVGPYWEWQFAKAGSLLHLGRFEEGRELMELALAQRPQKARVLFSKIWVLRKLGRVDEAGATAALFKAIEP
jgi:tetratricopeptide (TPR) repeat protein